MKDIIKQAVKEHKLIAIVRGAAPDKCIRIAQALYDGGFRLMEITYDQRDPQSWESTAQAIGAVAQAFDGRLFVGAGTVTSPELVELTARYGGQFIVSPDANEAVIRRSVELGLVSMPGALTPTEILAAHRAGADFVKLFPAGNLGTGYLKAVIAPISHVDILAVGGIDVSNLSAFLAAGAVGAGIGGSLVNSALVKAGQYDKITQTARLLVEAAK